MAQPTRDSFFILSLLSEAEAGECKAVVLVIKHTSRYAAEQNYWLVPQGSAEAGGKI